MGSLRAVFIASSAALLAACDCTTRIPGQFACERNDDCVSGFSCVGGVCSDVAGAGGGTAGGGTAGGGTAGGGTAGGGMAGGGTAGGGTAGGGTAGGGTAGGGTAGGGTAGGGTAGGGTAGGGAAGGAGGGGPTGLVFTTTPPGPLLAFTCLQVQVEARIGIVVTTVAQATTVMLSVSLVDGARFYSDATCATATTAAIIPAGQASATFWMRPITGETTLMITAMAPFGSAVQAVTARPVVKRGACSMQSPQPDGGEDLFAFCGFPSDLLDVNHAFIVPSWSANTTSSATQMLRCRIVDTNNAACEREVGSSSASIEWQVVELPYGLTVRHELFSCATPPMLHNIPAVNLASSFLLRTNRGAGGGIDDDDLVVARLISPTQIEVDFGAPGATCAGADYNMEVVDFSGASVTRGIVDGGMPADNPDGGQPRGVITYTELGLSPVGPNTMLLVQPRAANAAQLCTELARGDMPSPTSITFTRGSGNPLCSRAPLHSLEWQRIDFGARATVQTRQVTLPAGQNTITAQINSVDRSRAFAIVSGMPNGNGGGETDYDVGINYGSEGMARVQLTTPTGVTLTRQRTTGTARFTLYVVELEP